MSDAAPAEEADPLTDPDELLYRLVIPDWFDHDEDLPMNVAFRPSKIDKGEMSVDRAVLTPDGPEQSFRRRIEVFELKPAYGVWGLTVGEAANEWDDEQEVTVPALNVLGAPVDGNPAHAFLDFRGESMRRQRENKSKQLRRFAVRRGCLYQPPQN